MDFQITYHSFMLLEITKPVGKLTLQCFRSFSIAYFSKLNPNPVSLTEASVLLLLKCVKLPFAIWSLKRPSLNKNSLKIANISEIKFSLPCNFTFKIFRCSVMSLKKASSRSHLGSAIKSASSFFPFSFRNSFIFLRS